MVASPEICQLNGRKSHGPVSSRGKAIASRNATKHGLLAKQPPLLLSEDLETFQGIVQGLIDEYQPQTPTEHLLVQQLAMAWLRLHRLWGVEAAIANINLLKVEKETKYPKPDSIGNALLASVTPKSRFELEVLKKERETLSMLEFDLREWMLPQIPETVGRWQPDLDWIEEVQEILEYVMDQYPQAAIPKDGLGAVEPDCIWDRVFYLQRGLKSDKEGDFTCFLPLLKQKTQELLETCQNRIAEIDDIVADITRIDQETQRARVATLGIPDISDRLTRYERHITKQLHDALDRLQVIQQQRCSAGFIGSFGN